MSKTRQVGWYCEHPYPDDQPHPNPEDEPGRTYKALTLAPDLPGAEVCPRRVPVWITT